MQNLAFTKHLSMSNMLNIVTMELKKHKTVKSEVETIRTTVQTQDPKEIFLDKKLRRSQSYATKHGYGIAIDRLIDFARFKYNLDLGQLIHAIKEKKLDSLDVLDDFYTFLSKHKKPHSTKVGLSKGSIRTYITISKEFLNSNGIRLFNEEVRQRLQLPQKEDVYEEGLTKEIINRIVRASSLKLTTSILLQASSGMRLGEMIQLRLSDVNFDTNPTTIQIRKETTKTRQTRFTHITTEAASSLKDYLSKTFAWNEGTKGDRYIFLQTHDEKITKYKAQLQDPKTDKRRIHLLKRYISELENELKTLSESELYNRGVVSCKNSFEEMLRSIVKTIPDLAIKNKENDRYHIHYHALRAWFKTNVTDAHQSDFAEALMGHKSLKMIYYRQNHQKREKTYRGIEHVLTISDTEVIEKNLAQIQDSEQELRELVKEMRQEHKEEMRTLRNWVTEVISGYKKTQTEVRA